MHRKRGASTSNKKVTLELVWLLKQHHSAKAPAKRLNYWTAPTIVLILLTWPSLAQSHLTSCWFPTFLCPKCWTLALHNALMLNFVGA